MLENTRRNVACYISALILAGCASNGPYHKLNVGPGNCDPSLEDSDESIDCRNSYLQHYEHHTIAVAEYTERGNHFSDESLDNIINYIDERSSDKGVVTLVFVHGWNHNSEETEERTDSNLADFKNVIAEIAKDASNQEDNFNLNGRALVGLYVGWRGRSLLFPKSATYWERKAVAQNFGSNGLARLILELDRIDSKNPDNVLVTIGHSFGGAAVLTAVTEPLLSRVLEPSGTVQKTDPRCEGISCGIGDGIYLINPAIEANQVLPLIEATLDKKYSTKQPPLLVSISSEADWANKILFPLGQTAGLLATSRQAPLNRSYFRIEGDSDPIELREEALDSTAVGNFAPFLTHRIDVPDLSAWCRDIRDQVTTDPLYLDSNPFSRCEDYGAANACGPKLFPKGFDTTPRGALVSGRDQNSPLYFIRTNKHFMGGHNDIFNEHVVAFLSAQLKQGLISSINNNSYSNDLYNDPDIFQENYQEALEFSCKLNFGKGIVDTAR